MEKISCQEVAYSLRRCTIQFKNENFTCRGCVYEDEPYFCCVEKLMETAADIILTLEEVVDKEK